MNLFSAFEISGSGLSAERLRMDTISNNIANANTTHTPEGGPYRRQQVVFSPRQAEPLFLLPFSSSGMAQSQMGEGVRVTGVVSDPSAPKMVYDPGHPDADARGYVAMPNVNIVNEMVDLISASRAYEANVNAINSAKSMASSALSIGKA
jgi:flagellar basal-body rod protein FlgC